MPHMLEYPIKSEKSERVEARYSLWKTSYGLELEKRACQPEKRNGLAVDIETIDIKTIGLW